METNHTKSLLDITTHTNPSQVKRKKALRNQGKQSLSIKSSHKRLLKQESRSRASFYTDLTKYQKKVLSLIVSLDYKYSVTIPSQIWLADEVGCTIRTVNSALARFHKLGIINKRHRGWKLLRPGSNIFKSNTCQYTCGKRLLSDMKFIGKNSKKTDKHITSLLSLIPSLHHFFWGFFLLIVFNLNIGYLNSNIKYIRRENNVVYGLDNYETVKEYRILKKLPTFTLSTGKELNSVLPEVHPGNVCYNKYDYTKNNTECIKKLYIGALKRNGLDIRYCTEKDYYKLSYEDRIIASRYFSGRKRYGSVSAYENFLRKNGLYNKLWGRGKRLCCLSQDQKVQIELAPVNESYNKRISKKALTTEDKDKALSKIKDESLRELFKSYADNCRLNRRD